MPQSRMRIAFVVVSLATLVGCSGPGEDPFPDRPETSSGRSADGPLSVDGIAGGQSYLAPRSRPERWTASQGSFQLCTTDEPVTLKGVRLAGERQPLSVTPWLVSDTPKSSRDVTFGGVLGSPPDFAEPYADDGFFLRGSYTDEFDGTVIDDPCPAKTVQEGYSEVVLALETDSAGARVPYFWIDYRVGEEEYTLRVDWTIVLCGTEITKRCG